jgi:UDP-glucose 4-epimerase
LTHANDNGRWQDRAVLVSGGCGFIGSHLARLLLDRGVARLAVLDDLSVGSEQTLPTSGGRVELHRTDLGATSQDALRPLLREIDVVFHLAAVKHRDSAADPRRLLRTNVEGTYTLLEAAASAGVSKFVFSSTLYAYGRLSGAPMVETDTPAPRTLYGASKLAGEHLLEYFATARGLDAVALRLFFVYGPRRHPDSAYRSVILENFERLMAGRAPVVHGDGSQVLDYVYIDDVTRALCRAATIAGGHRLFNVGSGRATSIGKLTEVMQRVAGASGRVRRAPADETAGSSRVADIGRIRAELGWQPRVELTEGLERTYRSMTGKDGSCRTVSS